MAAEAAVTAGVEVDLYDRMGSVGRKLLIAGKGGLNLTHSEPRDAFVARYAERQRDASRWLDVFDADALRAWARGLGIETFVGTSGRVFPSDLKAAPLLRGWVRRLRAQGVRFHVQHDWKGWDGDALRFTCPAGEVSVTPDATVFALGGASWPVLGSDGAWTAPFEAAGMDVATLEPANCGFDVEWSPFLREHHAGAPIRPVVATVTAPDGTRRTRQGEFVLSAYGVEGSLVYALSAPLRDTIRARGHATLELDLAPQRDHAALERDLGKPRGKRSRSEHLRRATGLDAAKIALLHELLPRDAFDDAHRVAAAIKALPILLRSARPVAEAISSAGGVWLEGLDDSLMLHARPGTFVAGEMLDWEAPTGGYLLTACFATGLIAGRAAAEWSRARA